MDEALLYYPVNPAGLPDQVPVLAYQVSTKTVVSFLVGQHEPGGLIDFLHRGQDVVGPQGDLLVADLRSEAQAFPH